MPVPKVKASFIEPMLLLRREKLPDGPDWIYEIKLDGFRAMAFKSSAKVHLRSRNDNDFSLRYSGVTKALAKLPDETVVDREIVALDEAGKPSFNTLRNYGTAQAPVFFYIFDLLILAGRDLRKEPLSERRALLEKRILPKLAEPIRYSQALPPHYLSSFGRSRHMASKASWLSVEAVSTSPASDRAHGRR